MTTREQLAIARAELEIGRKFGLGPTWAVTRPTAATPAASPTTSTPAAVTGYVVEEQSRDAVTAPGLVTAAPRFVFVTAAATAALAPGDVLRSGAYAFRVRNADFAVGYAKYTVERL